MFERNATAYYVNNEEWLGSTPEATADMVTFADNKTVSPTTTWESPPWAYVPQQVVLTELKGGGGVDSGAAGC